MKYSKLILTLPTIIFLVLSNIVQSQDVFSSRKELNNFIFQNSDLEIITKGYFLNLNTDYNTNFRESYFTESRDKIDMNQILTFFKILEDTDVKQEFEMDNVLFPVMDRLYSNNGINPIRIPIFIGDITFSYLNQDTYENFSNWTSTSPFPELNNGQIDEIEFVFAGLFVDSLVNQNIKFYWDDNTYFTNTNRTIEEVNLIINNDTIQLEKGRLYDLIDFYNGNVSAIDLSISFSDGSVVKSENKVYLSNGTEKNDCAEQFGFTGNDRPWESLGGLCKWGVDTIHNESSEDFPYLYMNFSVLWGCGAPKVLDKPYIIVSGWGPYTDKFIINEDQGWPTSIEDLYVGYNQEGFIDNLVDSGHDVIIVKFYPPNQSVLKNSILLERLIKMVNEEKYLNGSNQENIISGYSAGAMCVRLTLQRMEKEHLDGMNEHHHSKLFVSYDGEHGGANIPLGLQHCVEYLEEYHGGITNLNIVYALHYILNAPLSRELLKYFYTETGTSSALTIGQGPHQDRVNYIEYHNWFNHIKNTHNPGYPSFTRNISISNGTSQSSISGTTSDHFPFPSADNHIIFEHERSFKKWKASFIGPGTPWVFKYEEKSWGQWNIIEEARVKNALLLDNAPGGTTFLANLGSSGDPNVSFQVLDRMEDKVTSMFQSEADYVDYEALYSFTPTILTHDIRNFEPFIPFSNAGRLNYDMKAEGLMYQNLIDIDPNQPNYSSYWGYPHLAHPQNHYTNYTPFDAVFSWDKANTVHIQSGEAEFNPSGNEGRGKWQQVHSPIRGVIKNFILAETDFYNAFIQNRRYGWNARNDYIYRADITAKNEIYAGSNVTQRTNFKSTEILENANVSFKACKSVILKPGFHAQSGSEFHAEVSSEVCGCGGTKSNYNSKQNSNPINQEDIRSSSKKEKVVNTMDVRLYPNPGKNKVNLQIYDENIRNFEYIIFDLQGNKIAKDFVVGSFTTIELNKGIYIVKININNEWHTKKLIMY